MELSTRHTPEKSLPATIDDAAVFSHQLAYRLRELRASSGLTQESVAEQAGIAAYTYQKFEKGESKPGTPMNPRLYTLLALANVFEISVTDLLDVSYDATSSGSESEADVDLWPERTIHEANKQTYKRK